MALQVRVAPSKVVLKNLLICVILFYTVYYVCLSLCCLTLKFYELDVLAPFDFKTTPSWHSTNYKVLLVSTEVTYFLCGLLFVLVVEEWLWDYAISVTILHVAITSAVMLEFPWTSHWWAALGILELFRFGFFNAQKLLSRIILEEKIILILVIISLIIFQDNDDDV
ncbi:transmembrane protein 244 [Ochotona princeps]|uniref:transmembrane protein 244 n=1 Tax=Ochotona princeps TaxID=9978 RepID=UPI00032AF05A|nr:transmembrane protein 244 [Ochotona princeps]